MTRFLPLAAAALATVSAAAAAQGPVGFYVAVPVAAATKASLITRTTPWTLQQGAYVARQAPERDMVLCQLVARDAGKLQSFTVAGKAYDEAAMEKCNAHAK